MARLRSPGLFHRENSMVPCAQSSKKRARGVTAVPGSGRGIAPPPHNLSQSDTGCFLGSIRGPLPSSLRLRPSRLCGTPALRTRHRSFYPGPLALAANRTMSADFGGSLIGLRGTPVRLLGRLRSSAIRRLVIRALGRTNPGVRRRATCPERQPRRAASPPPWSYLFSPAPPAPQERSPQSSECLWFCCLWAFGKSHRAELLSRRRLRFCILLPLR